MTTLEVLRRVCGFSPSELAIMTHMDCSRLIAIERGEVAGTLGELQDLGCVLGVAWNVMRRDSDELTEHEKTAPTCVPALRGGVKAFDVFDD